MGELKKKAVRGLAWNTANKLANRCVTFTIGVVLARLLTPADYGMLGMVGVFTSVLTLFTDGGLTMALVRKEDRTEADMATVFWYNLVACWSIYAIIFFAAPYIAEFYEMPLLKDVTRVTTISLIYSPFGGIQSVLMTTRIDFKTPAIIGVCCNIISGLVAILMAFNGYGVWALVLQGMVSSFISVAARVWIVRWFPKERFSVKSFKELFGFSSKMLASWCLGRVYENIAPLIIGKYYSPAKLGSYERACGWANLPSQTFTSVLQGVTFPVLSKMQDDIERLAINYRKLLRLSAFCVFPMMVGLASIAHPLTLFVLTDKWKDTIILLQLVCFSMMWYPIHAINLNLLTVKGRSDLFFRLELIKRGWGLMIMCCTLPFGLVYFVAAGIVSSLFSLVINTYYTGKLINVGYWKQMSDLWPILLNSLIMGVLCIAIQIPIENNGIRLAIAIPTGVIYYITSAILLKSEEFKELILLIKRRGR